MKQFQLEHPESFRLEPQAEARSKRRSLPPGWQRRRGYFVDYGYETAQRWEQRSDGSVLDARVDPMGTVDGGREWTVELLGPENGTGQRETIGDWEGTYRGSLVDGAEAAERCIAEHVQAIPAKEPTC